MYNDEVFEEVALSDTFIYKSFNRNAEMSTIDISHFTVSVKVCASPTFYRWVFGWNGSMKILGPEKVVAEYKEMAKKVLEY